MSETERETAGAVRSAHVAHFMPADWSAIAPRMTGALERIDRALGELQLLVIVPDSSGAVALARELRTLDAATGVEMVPVTSAARAERLFKESSVQVVLGSAHALAGMLRASAIKLGGVRAVVFAAADEYDAASDDLALVMAEVPKTGTRLLTATTASPAVEQVLERYLHKARRVGGTTAPEPGAVVAPAVTVYARTVSADAPLAPLGELLDELDPPSTVIVVCDDRSTAAAREALDGLGYNADTALVTIANGTPAPNSALVVFVGIPTAATLAETVATQPGRLVALVTARQRASLERLAGVTVLPWERSRTAREALVREDELRATIRATITAGLPTREVLALEPLLSDFDGLAIAAAALKMYEREKLRADGLAAARTAGRGDSAVDVRAPRDTREAAPARERTGFDRDSRESGAPRERKFERDSGPPRAGKFNRESSGPPRAGRFGRDRGDSGPSRERSFGGDRGDSRPPRKFDRDSGPPRTGKFGRDAAPPRDRTFGGEARPARKYNSDGGPAARGGPARGGRDDRPARGGDSRPSRPVTRGPRRDDAGRPPRKEK